MIRNTSDQIAVSRYPIQISKNEKYEIYKTGKGSFLIRSNWHIENIKNGLYQIVITQIPFQVNKTRLIEQLVNLINAKNLNVDVEIDGGINFENCSKAKDTFVLKLL